MANLLTIEAKKKLERDWRMRQIIIAFVLVSILFLIAAIFNLALWLNFRIQKQPLLTSTPASTSTLTDKEATEAREKINQLTKWWSVSDWSLAISKVKQLQPSTIKINQLAGVINEKDNSQSLAIAGQATNRDDLTKFADALRQDKFFSLVDLPIESLLTTSKGQFTISLKIKKND